MNQSCPTSSTLPSDRDFVTEGFSLLDSVSSVSKQGRSRPPNRLHCLSKSLCGAASDTKFQGPPGDTGLPGLVQRVSE